VKTGVQSIRKALKTLDSGFRRNDVKRSQINFFTPSPLSKGGLGGFEGIFYLKLDSKEEETDGLPDDDFALHGPYGL
jgi:hypothetical protein